MAQGVPSAVILDVLVPQDVRLSRRYQHATGSPQVAALEAATADQPGANHVPAAVTA